MWNITAAEPGLGTNAPRTKARQRRVKALPRLFLICVYTVYGTTHTHLNTATAKSPRY